MDNDCLGHDNCQNTIEDEIIYHVADFFKIFGDQTRVKILKLLLEKEMSVGKIAEDLNMTQSAVSHQLRVLRQNELVKNRKDGKIVYYSLDDDHVENILRQGIGHIRHKKRV
ncbi:MAG: helix-turn-helix transcriptional regulator [Firmicutes bacterium]|nr:helix-turn-helix transcriptional regulator [Bacillota bacterium]